MIEGSRIPGFYRLSLQERRSLLSEHSGVPLDQLSAALCSGGLDPDTADKIVENAVGVYSLPFGIAVNVRVNDRDRLVPMVVEEPSVIAAASNAARIVRKSGGFRAEVTESLMIGQIELRNVADPQRSRARLLARTAELLAHAARAVPGLLARGGGPRELEVRDLGQGSLVVHVLVDCCDAMGANLVNTVTEILGPEMAEIAGGVLGLRILSNLCDRRRVRARCRIGSAFLGLNSRGGGRNHSQEAGASSQRAFDFIPGGEVLDAIVAASRFAEHDPYRAATHNKGIMNGVDAVVIATGNDFRAVEAGAHAYAARSGRYAPLATWRRDGDDLVGELEMPLALGTVGGTLRVHAGARLALRILGTESADELATIVASMGLASNLAALRALATEGIQRGHMALHARSVAVAAGAYGSEVEVVASRIAASGSITLEAAQQVLRELRANF